jgi:hypothetical protein
MNLRSRLPRLFVVVFIILNLFTLPASSDENSTYDTTDLSVPEDVSYTVDGIEYDGNYSYLMITIDTSLDTTSKFLYFNDFKIEGLPESEEPAPPALQYFDGDSFYENEGSFYSQVQIYLSEQDLASESFDLVISGNGTLEDKGDISFPDSYSSIVDKLDALGVEVVDGNNTWSVDAENENQFGFYVTVQLKEGVEPFQLKVKSSTLAADDMDPEELNFPQNPISIGTEEVEIDLGYSSVDPNINLIGTTLDADFEVYSPSTIKSEVVFPSGLRAMDNGEYYYDKAANKTYVNLALKNTTKSSISITVASIIVVNSKVDAKKSVATVTKENGLITVPSDSVPSNSPAMIQLVGNGDLTQNRKLIIKGKATVVVPSKLDLTKVTVPNGLTIMPIDLSNFDYDLKTDKTTLYLEIRSKKADKNAPALSFENITSTTALVKSVNPFAAPFVSDINKVNTYFAEIGTFKGDVRVGKKLALSGNVTSFARTKYTNTATLNPQNDSIGISQDPVQPEYWKYDAKKKTTTVFQYFWPDESTKSATIYTCNLKIVLNGKAVKAITKGTTFNAPFTEPQITIAVLPGDLRVKGGTLAVTGNYTLQPCK